MVKNKILIFTLGAIAGGAFFAWSTDAIPKMTSRMMQNMMVRMKDEGCNPEDI